MQSALIALEIAGKLNRIPIDTRVIIKEYALSEEEPSSQELTRIAVNQGFRASVKKLPIDKLLEAYPMQNTKQLQNNTNPSNNINLSQYMIIRHTKTDTINNYSFMCLNNIRFERKIA